MFRLNCQSNEIFLIFSGDISTIFQMFIKKKNNFIIIFGYWVIGIMMINRIMIILKIVYIGSLSNFFPKLLYKNRKLEIYGFYPSWYFHCTNNLHYGIKVFESTRNIHDSQTLTFQNSCQNLFSRQHTLNTYHQF